MGGEAHVAGADARNYLMVVTGPESGTCFLEITPDGRFFVKGQEVETGEAVRDSLVAFADEVCKGYGGSCTALLRNELAKMRSVVELVAKSECSCSGSECLRCRATRALTEPFGQGMISNLY